MPGDRDLEIAPTRPRRRDGTRFLAWPTSRTVVPGPTEIPDEEETMQIIDNSRRPRAHLPGVEHCTLACADDGLATLSLWQQSLEAGAATPPHRHDCDEVVVVTAGRGTLRAGDDVRAFGPGMTLVIRRGVEHQITAMGPGALELIAAFGATPVGTFAPDGAPLELPWRT
jgi:mannose-6-phosphate isomerase-like protein (cupin superfamily)